MSISQSSVASFSLIFLSIFCIILTCFPKRYIDLDNLNKILCPVDLSEKSSILLQYAISFSKKFDTLPEILHVSTRPPDVYYRFFPDVAGVLKRIEQDAQSQMKKFTSRLGAELEATIRYGTVYEEIVNYANEDNFDLTIIDSDSYSTIEGHHLSLAVQKVIRKADCPVLTVYGERPEADIRKIVCPLDFSTYSYQGLASAALLARKFNARLYVHHVVELADFKKTGVQFDDDFVGLLNSLEEELKIPDEMNDLDIEKVITSNDDAADGIVDFARNEEVDLIAMTTHGRSYLPRLLLGSVAERVLQTAPCPVLTLRVHKGV